MCGIVGIANLDGKPVSRSSLQAMADAVEHRGPDGSGYFVDNNIGLGHRRLSIIDISALGSQPMQTADGNFVLSYNGEIYNFRELRLELQALGHAFKSQADSEVVLEAWRAWGPKCVERFNGMFAFAIWDKVRNSLFLARDRYGIKPVYWIRSGDQFLFGSEQKAVLANSGIRRSLDKSALVEYFTFQNIFTDRTLLDGISILPPATILELDMSSGGRISTTRYWDFHFEEPRGKYDLREYREELDRLLTQAVYRQMVSDVEVGSYLSGGMDSGTLTALAVNEVPYIKTFTCGFDISSASGIELAYDERQKAEAMSAVFRTEHYEMVLKAGDMERCLSTLAYHIEEPRVGQSYPNFYAAKLASKFVKVVLSGAGGDELFGGYPWRYYRAVNCQNFDDYVSQYYQFWHRLTHEKDRNALFAPIARVADSIDPRDIFRDVFKSHDNQLDCPEDYINHSLYFEAKTFLHGLFVIEDKISMSQSLETRVPFMDNDLVDFAMRCPVGMKLNNLVDVIEIDENEIGKKQSSHFQKTKDGKQILRDVMAQYIPDEIASGTKQGFSAPDASWFRGESIDFVRKKLIENDSPIYDYLDRETVHRIINTHLDGHENRRLFIWSALNFDSWLEQTL